MTAFTPLPALAGGALIGGGATVLWLGIGRVAGISGIFGGVLGGVAERGWRLAFLAGLVGAAPIYALFFGMPAQRIAAGAPLLAIAGLLVGFGTRLGNGCTSGHGVCGVARLSKRSLAATGVFMGTAMMTVFVARHIAGWR